MPFVKTDESLDEQLQRFFTKIKEINGCWVWQAAKDLDGYGVFRTKNVQYGAHRWAYLTFYGPIAPRMVLDHFICENRSCVNPQHVKPVSVKQNTLRSKTAPAAINARKTHCKHGHLLSGDNLKIYFRGNTRIRHCITCRKIVSSGRRTRKMV